MSVGVATALSWSTAGIELTAGRFSAWANDVSWCTTDFGASTDPGQAWRGRAADNATELADRIAVNIQRLALSLTDGASALRFANERLSETQSRLRSLRARVAACGDTMSDDGSVTPAAFRSSHLPNDAQFACDVQAYNGRVALARSLSMSAQSALADCISAERMVASALRDSLDVPRRLTRGWVLDEASLLQTFGLDPRVQAAIDSLHDLMAHPGNNRDRLRQLTQALQAMTPDQLAAYLAACSDEVLGRGVCGDDEVTRRATAAVAAMLVTLSACTSTGTAVSSHSTGASTAAPSTRAVPRPTPSWTGVPNKPPTAAPWAFHYGWGAFARGHATQDFQTPNGLVRLGADMSRPAADGTVVLTLERVTKASVEPHTLKLRPGVTAEDFGLKLRILSIEAMNPDDGEVYIHVDAPAPPSQSASAATG